MGEAKPDSAASGRIAGPPGRQRRPAGRRSASGRGNGGERAPRCGGKERIAATARSLVEAARAGRGSAGGVDSFMHEYGLSSEEGVLLLCLAEALLRIPDAATADRLIAGTVGGGDWARHHGHSDSLLVNASTFGLMLTGRLLDWSGD